MSLTSMVAEPATRDFLEPRITVPRIMAPELVVEPRGGNVQRIGTAFDYALRYGLRARVNARHWEGTVASSAVEHIVSRLAPGRLAEARERLAAALAIVESMDVGPLADAASEACLDLAALDWVYRSQRLESLDTAPDPGERAELQALFAIVPWDEFAVSDRAILNPTFGVGSRMVGGADADLWLDGALIDIKTTKSTSMKVGYVRQLVGYATLAEEFGIDGLGERRVHRIGIYFSRAGSLQTWALDEIMSETARREFAQHLRDRTALGGSRRGGPGDDA